jgi:hypothetical protein
MNDCIDCKHHVEISIRETIIYINCICPDLKRTTHDYVYGTDDITWPMCYTTNAQGGCIYWELKPKKKHWWSR